MVCKPRILGHAAAPPVWNVWPGITGPLPDLASWAGFSLCNGRREQRSQERPARVQSVAGASAFRPLENRVTRVAQGSTVCEVQLLRNPCGIWPHFGQRKRPPILRFRRSEAVSGCDVDQMS